MCNFRRFHLEQTEPARAELVFALTVLKREKLYELVDEHWVCEMIKDDLLQLLRRIQKRKQNGVLLDVIYYIFSCYYYH